jgi:hypothetical protein
MKESSEFYDRYEKAIREGDTEKAREVRDEFYDWAFEHYTSTMDKLKMIDSELAKDHPSEVIDELGRHRNTLDNMQLGYKEIMEDLFRISMKMAQIRFDS